MSQHHLYSNLRTNEIRIVGLLPGPWQNEIQCELFHRPLSDITGYKALSYAWGSPKALRPISLDGNRHLITTNLESALRRLRQRDAVVTLWVDAISINQSDDTERSVQVGLMREIYMFADEVIVYLGEPEFLLSASSSKRKAVDPIIFYGDSKDDDKLEVFRDRCVGEERHAKPKVKDSDYTSDVFCLLRFLASDLKIDSIPPFDSKSRPNIESSYQRNVFEALRQLMRCRWWDRIWVIQEIVVGKSITVIYDSTAAPWDMIVSAARCCSNNLYSPILLSFPHEYTVILKFFSYVVLDIHRMRERWRTGEGTTLLTLLRRFSGRRATDDRDKVYALLGLARDKDFFKPNYELDVPMVFQSTVLSIMEETGSLDVLIGDLGRKNRQDIPSWVPDWSAVYDDLDRRRAENAVHYNASEFKDRKSVDIEKVTTINFYTNAYGHDVNQLNIVEKDTSGVLHQVTPRRGFTSPDLRDKDSPTLIRDYFSEFFYFRQPFDTIPQMLEVPGFYIDSVDVVGEVNFSSGELCDAVRSWEVLVADFFRFREYDCTEESLGAAFRATLCASMIRTGDEAVGYRYRRIISNDRDLIRSWFLGILFGETDSIISSDLFPTEETEEVDTTAVDAAVRSAITRRTLFITSKGYIGLGPPSMRQGDKLYILLGGNTPFILRNVDYKSFKVVGDCYAHGVMDGEVMPKWRVQAIKWLEEEMLRHPTKWMEGEKLRQNVFVRLV